MLNGNTVGLSGVLGNILNPLVTLSSFNFNVDKVDFTGPDDEVPAASSKHSCLRSYKNGSVYTSIMELDCHPYRKCLEWQLSHEAAFFVWTNGNCETGTMRCYAKMHQTGAHQG